MKACVKCGKEFEQGALDACPEDGTTLVTINGDLAAGTILGDRYEVIERIADGGMGKIYKAKHKLIDKYVAVKTLLPNLVMSGAVLKRFQQEADAISKLNHPNILSVTDFFVSQDGHPYLVMDFLQGESLQSVIDSGGALPEPRAMHIFSQVCAALKHAHLHGIIHRDLKPSNVMLVKQDEQEDVVKLIDFGIAKVITEGQPKTQLTETGDVFGSPPYMSPEQCRGKPLDARSDIYSLGCILFAMLTGKPPFVCNEDVEYMFKHVHEAPPTLPAGTSPTVIAAVEKMLAKEPEGRFESIGELMATLQGSGQVAAPVASAPAKVPPKSRVPILVGIAVVGGGVVIAVGIRLAALVSSPPLPESATGASASVSDSAKSGPASAAVNVVQAFAQPLNAGRHSATEEQNARAAVPIAVAPKPLTRVQQFDAAMTAGKSAFASQDYPAAQAAFNQAHDIAFGFGEEDPRFVSSLEWQGKTMLKQGNYEAAVQAFDFVVSARKTGARKSAEYQAAEQELAAAKAMLRRLQSR